MVLAATVFGSCSAAAQTQSQIPSCQEVFKRLWNDRPNNTPEEFRQALEETLSPASSPGCAAEYIHAVEPQLQATALKLFKPTRQNLLKALQNYSAQQQQTSTTSSTASVTPVSKVTGPSAIAEEFSGVSISSSTSAMTFQFTPGTLVPNLKLQDVIVPCSSTLRINRDCLSAPLQTFFEMLTLSISANTSTAGQSIKGTATSGTSGSTAAAATLSTAGTTEPSFGGFGVKVVAIYTSDNSKTAGKNPGDVSDAQKQLDSNLSKYSAEFYRELIKNCPTYVAASQGAIDALASPTTQDLFFQSLQGQYAPVGNALLACLQSDNLLAKDLQNYLAAVLVAEANNEDLGAARKPLLGFEYDLNTPPNQPSYSSLKSNFTFTFGKTASEKATEQAKKAAAKGQTGAPSCGREGGKATSIGQPACAAAKLAVIAASQTSARGAAEIASQSDSLSNSKSQNAAAKGTASANTKPWTINASVGVDLYNSEPSSSIPSASHLRDVQAGVEIDYLVPSSKIPVVGPLIGDSTLAGTYYYQDQTSPSILKGPPQSITIADLPSTATQVYTTRGPINLGQIRLGLGTGTNVSFPICFTYSNRSALIAHPIKGVQFGLSYNLSSLFASSSTK
jgi:hypothetical protein